MVENEKKVQAVLFDLDGVLVDACEWHYEALNSALREFVGKEISREDHLTKFNGLPTRVKLKMLGFDGRQAQIIEELKQRHTIRAIEELARPMHSQIELLKKLKLEGVKLACVTNSIKMTAVLMLEKTEQIGFFDILVTNESVERNKPHPDCYNFAINLLKVDPKMAICVEDSEKGAEAARLSDASYLWRVSGVSDVNHENYLRFLNENFDSDGGRGK